jgi:hypothetical protein
VQKPEDGMGGDRETVFRSFLEPREVIVRDSESSDTNVGLQKTGGMLQHAVCTIGHMFEERERGLFGPPEEELLEWA